jgi:hypothetical protein
MKTFTVYKVTRKNTVLYVGATTRKLRARWRPSLLSKCFGEGPFEVCSIDACADAAAMYAAEKTRILELSPQFNKAIGGPGANGYRHTSEARAKISAAGRRTCKDETRTKISVAHYGMKHSLMAKDRMRLAHVGIALSTEHKAKLSVAQKARRAREQNVVRQFAFNGSTS